MLKVGELATFAGRCNCLCMSPLWPWWERSCWRQNMEQKEAVLRFLKEQAFEPGDRLPKHLREFEVADVQRCLSVDGEAIPCRAELPRLGFRQFGATA